MCPPTVLCLVLCAQAASNIAFSTAMVLRSHSLYWSSMRMGSLCKVQSCVVHSWIGVVCMRMLVCVFELVYIVCVYTKRYWASVVVVCRLLWVLYIHGQNCIMTTAEHILYVQYYHLKDLFRARHTSRLVVFTIHTCMTLLLTNCLCKVIYGDRNMFSPTYLSLYPPHAITPPITPIIATTTAHWLLPQLKSWKRMSMYCQ